MGGEGEKGSHRRFKNQRVVYLSKLEDVCLQEVRRWNVHVFGEN